MKMNAKQLESFALHPRSMTDAELEEATTEKPTPPANDDDRGTPQALFDWCNEKWGPFEVDLCAAEWDYKCAKWYDGGIQGDGLAADVRGMKVWCNPPYSDIKTWLIKCMTSHADRVVMLLPANRTDSEWWAMLEETRDTTRGGIRTHFLRKRVKFEYPPGQLQKNAPKNASVIVVLEGPATRRQSRQELVLL